MSKETIKIKKGIEDRMSFLAMFADRKAIEIETEKGDKRISINEIMHEDGSGYSYIFKGFDLKNKKEIKGYYGFKLNSGWIMYI